MSSQTGLSRRRVAAASSSNDVDDEDMNPSGSTNASTRPALASTSTSNSYNDIQANGNGPRASHAGTALAGGSKVAYDPRDLVGVGSGGDEDGTTPRFTLLEEILLLGIKDRAVCPCFCLVLLVPFPTSSESGLRANAWFWYPC
ncbi:hypothetical protein FRC14_005382 [Serendipita sp. 396]|nr:hypothetical protein FRC14_005382 [Serendipita sp. 396]KAG8779788.1 hypothetical protein FRC15_009937 [Serendipita sp. 397]KAG8823016.1 hypothetical protein FRC18_010839 [Serendipita sp. 400]KAG8848180.1 hypothetical protein FRB91_011055 [Serendipita sp. 411]